MMKLYHIHLLIAMIILFNNDLKLKPIDNDNHDDNDDSDTIIYDESKEIELNEKIELNKLKNNNLPLSIDNINNEHNNKNNGKEITPWNSCRICKKKLVTAMTYKVLNMKFSYCDSCTKCKKCPLYLTYNILELKQNKNKENLRLGCSNKNCDDYLVMVSEQQLYERMIMTKDNNNSNVNNKNINGNININNKNINSAINIQCDIIGKNLGDNGQECI